MAQFFLPNPGFELGDQDWTKGTGLTIEDDVANSRSGAWVAKITPVADALRQAVAVNVRPGAKLSLSAWVKQTSDYDGTPGVACEWFDKDGVLVSTSTVDTIAAGTTAYTQASVVDIVAPDLAKSAKASLSSGSETVGNAWFDDAEMSGDIIEAIPATADISSYRVVPADTIGVFDPLIGPDKFTEFNAGMSDKWAGVFTFTPLALGGDINSLLAFLGRIGKTERFFAFDPDRKTPVNGIVNGMTVDGATAQGTNRIPVTAGPVSSTALVAGDYIEVKDQYFQLQRDLEIGPEGTGDAIVWPAVRSTLADGEDVITDNPKMVARITSDLDWTRKAGDLTAPSISWEEV